MVLDAQPPSNSSPVATVPPEILCEIFQALENEDCIYILFSPVGRLKSYSSLFALPRVCSLWRNISLSQPTLWSTVSFNTVTTNTFVSPETIVKNEAFLRDFLQRSSNVILCLTVKCLVTCCPVAPEAVSALEVFADHAHRYRDLTFVFVEYEKLDRTWEILNGCSASGGILGGVDVDEGRLPRLESLTLKYHDSRKSPYSIRVKPFSHQCPRLHTLHVTSLYSDALPSGLNNLTTLGIGLYIGSLAILLTNHPLLKTLIVYDISKKYPSIPSPNLHPVYHTNMKTLIWGGTSVKLDYDPRAWDSVYLPNLTGLGVNIDTPSQWLDSDLKALLGAGGLFQAMKVMLIRSNCTLQNVSLYDIPEDVAKEFFRDVPMRKGCRNGRVVYNIPSKVPTVFPSSSVDLPEGSIIGVAED